MTKMHPSWRWALLAALLAALVALPAMAWAQNEAPVAPSPPRFATAAGPAIPPQLQSLWNQLLALREEHEQLGAELRDRMEANHDLMEQLQEKAKAGPAQDIRGLVEEFRLFQAEQLRPLREQAGQAQRAMAEARRERDREALATAQAELSSLLGQWRQSQEQANGLAARIRQLRQSALPAQEIIRECRVQLAPLHEQSRLIRLEIAQLRLAKDEAWANLRTALAADDLAAAEEALEQIIGLKTRIIDLTGNLLSLAGQAGAILEETLAKL